MRVNVKGIRGRVSMTWVELEELWTFPDTKHMDKEINNTNSYG